GKPLDQRRDGRDVADPKPESAQHAIAQQQNREAVHANADRAHEEATAEAAGRGEHGLARTHPVEPLSKECRGHAQKDNRRTEDPADCAQLPALLIVQRKVEDAEGVRLSNGKMNGQRGRRYAPAVVRGRRDGAVPIEKGEDGHSATSARAMNRPRTGAVRKSLGAPYITRRPYLAPLPPRQAPG